MGGKVAGPAVGMQVAVGSEAAGLGPAAANVSVDSSVEVATAEVAAAEEIEARPATACRRQSQGTRRSHIRPSLHHPSPRCQNPRRLNQRRQRPFQWHLHLQNPPHRSKEPHQHRRFHRWCPHHQSPPRLGLYRPRALMARDVAQATAVVAAEMARREWRGSGCSSRTARSRWTDMRIHRRGPVKRRELTG